MIDAVSESTDAFEVYTEESSESLSSLFEESHSQRSETTPIDSSKVTLFPDHPLHEAVFEGRIGLVRDLIANDGVDVNEPVGEVNETPLQLAAMMGRLEIAQLLIDAGADANGEPLRTAIARQDGDMIRLLVGSGSDLEHRDDGGATPILGAILEGNVEIAQLLVDLGASVHGVKWGDEDYLHLAARFTQPAMVLFFLDQGMDPNTTNELGATPLFISAVKGDAESARILLDRGSDPNHLDTFGTTPIFDAVYQRNGEIASLLLERGCRLDVKSNWGQTALDVAREKGYSEMVSLLEPHAPKPQGWFNWLFG